MALDRTTPEDATTLTDRRARLCALSQRIVDAVEAMPLPETFHEGERAARTIAFADRILEGLPGGGRSADGVIPPARQRLRDFADIVLSVIEDFDMPKTFRDGERALRCVASLLGRPNRAHAFGNHDFPVQRGGPGAGAARRQMAR